MLGSSWVAAQLAATREGHSSMELVCVLNTAVMIIPRSVEFYPFFCYRVSDPWVKLCHFGSSVFSNWLTVESREINVAVQWLVSLTRIRELQAGLSAPGAGFPEACPIRFLLALQSHAKKIYRENSWPSLTSSVTDLHNHPINPHYITSPL
jgi:hypothetical protein